MKVAVITNSGLEKLAQKEIKEIFNVDSIIEGSVLNFEVDDFDGLNRLQSIRRVILPFGEIIKGKVSFSEFNFKDYFNENIKLVVEVENVKGMDNRIEISKKVTEKLFQLLKNPSIDYKNPEKTIIVYDTGKKLVIGLDYFGKELDARDYRVFPHSASFKGDLAYYFVRNSDFKKGDKLLSGFCKDGAMAIEAAVFSSENIFAFDNSVPNIVAARKNAKLAKVEVEFNKYSLEDLDIKYKENFFDRLIFQVTKKDEDKLNEIYYQANYVLKKKGNLLLIGRTGWEVSISEKFKLLKEEEFSKGGSVHKLWLLEKK